MDIYQPPPGFAVLLLSTSWQEESLAHAETAEFRRIFYFDIRTKEHIGWRMNHNKNLYLCTFVFSF